MRKYTIYLIDNTGAIKELEIKAEDVDLCVAGNGEGEELHYEFFVPDPNDDDVSITVGSVPFNKVLAITSISGE